MKYESYIDLLAVKYESNIWPIWYFILQNK